MRADRVCDWEGGHGGQGGDKTEVMNRILGEEYERKLKRDERGKGTWEREREKCVLVCIGGERNY